MEIYMDDLTPKFPYELGGDLKYIETSAKDNILITELFKEIVEILYKDFVESGKGHKPVGPAPVHVCACACVCRHTYDERM